MNIHLIGIGGVGMAGLAVLLKNRGHAVTGCDLSSSPRTAWLAAQGIAVHRGHDASHVADAGLVIATPAVPVDSPERLAARKVCARGEVLAELVSAARDSIAVCGSHGKTTTSTWIAQLLRALGVDVEWAIGGETGAFPVAGGRPGGVLVVEADESDGTLAQYAAKTLVITNCEYDHPDHFPTLADYEACFEAARKKAGEMVEHPESMPSVPELDALLATLAPHNALNARMAAEVALRRGFAPQAIAQALAGIVETLPDRRFQRLAEGVYTDYAHHPTEMRCAVEMARRKCSGKLRVLFQPHRYSRTKSLLKSFPSAFALADEVLLCPVYAAFEQPLEGGTTEDLHAACVAAYPTQPVFRLMPSCEAAWEAAVADRRPGDVILLLGAGDIISLAPRASGLVQTGRK